MTEHNFHTRRTARYFTSSEASEKIKTCWIVLHGYAQSAQEFILPFEQLHDEHTLIVAPEGLSRFYRKSYSEVVASWMTRAQRVGEIEDYTAYLSSVYRQIIPKCAKDVQIIVLGFSQGSTTLTRWLAAKKPRFHHALIWGWVLPEDIDYTKLHKYLKNKQLWLICGDEDQLVSREMWAKNIDFAKKQALPFREIMIKGSKHEVTQQWVDVVQLSIAAV